MTRPHAWLFRCALPGSAALPVLARLNEALCVAHADLSAYRPLEGGSTYVFVERDQTDDIGAAGEALAGCLGLAPGAVSGHRLDLVFECAGASAGRPAPFHYVVETNPAEGWGDEIARWYDTEHMPGLASVPGCVLARRYLNADGGPLSYACYDLEAPEVLGSPPWLAVRHTEWSSRVRPQFRDTLRTMFRNVSRLA
jgi:hypothetical protein